MKIETDKVRVYDILDLNSTKPTEEDMTLLADRRIVATDEKNAILEGTGYRRSEDSRGEESQKVFLALQETYTLPKGGKLASPKVEERQYGRLEGVCEKNQVVVGDEKVVKDLSSFQNPGVVLNARTVSKEEYASVGDQIDQYNARVETIDNEEKEAFRKIQAKRAQLGNKPSLDVLLK